MQLTLSQPYIKGPWKNFTTIFRFCYWQTPESRQQHASDQIIQTYRLIIVPCYLNHYDKFLGELDFFTVGNTNDGRMMSE